MTDLVERLVPERVVPLTEAIRPQGGGRRRAGDRECLAAIVFVATSGCTWRQLPLVFGRGWPTVYRRFAQWSRDRVRARVDRVILDELGARGELGWSRCAIDSVSVRAAKRGPLTGPNPTDRGKSGSKSPDHRPKRRAAVAGHLRCQPARQPGPGTARARDPAHPLPPRTAPPTPGQAPGRQGLPLRPSAEMASRASYPPPHRPQGHRVLHTARPTSLGRREDGLLAGRMPKAAPPLRAQGRTLPGLVGIAVALIGYRRLTN